MPRLPRGDRAGRWFHVFHRGIARRPVFETRADVRFFLVCLARAVRRGELEVHAYCVLTTHFHLLVRSPTGQLGQAMDRVLNAYVRYFNRARRRDGALFRGRYGSRPVDSLEYRAILLRYIDHNPVQARLAARAEDYVYGSAWHYARARRPLWLRTDWADGLEVARGSSDPVGRDARWGAPTAAEVALVRARMRAPVPADDPLDDLIAAAPPAVLAWMRRKARLADRTAPGFPVVDGPSVRRVVAEARDRDGPWRGATPGGQQRDVWPAVEAVLLRELAGFTQRQIAASLGVVESMAARRVRQGRDLLEDAEAGSRVAALARKALDRALSSRGPAHPEK